MDRHGPRGGRRGGERAGGRRASDHHAAARTRWAHPLERGVARAGDGGLGRRHRPSRGAVSRLRDGALSSCISVDLPNGTMVSPRAPEVSSMTHRFSPLALAAAALVTTAAWAQDAGVTGTKLVIVDKLAATSKAKTVFVTKGDPDIGKGVEGDPALLEGTLEVFYEDDADSAVGAFLIPSPWAVNKATVAKYVNKLAPTGGEVKVAVVKPGSVAKVVAKGLGDGQAMDLSSPPGPNGVRVVFSISNGNDFSQHRMCTRFSTGDGSTII